MPGSARSSVSGLVALAWAMPLAWLVGLPPTQVWLAYAPGGVETTALLAMALGLDAAFVSSHHIMRVVILNRDRADVGRAVHEEGDEPVGSGQASATRNSACRNAFGSRRARQALTQPTGAYQTRKTSRAARKVLA